MNRRTRTFASLITVATGAMITIGLIAFHLRKPDAAQAQAPPATTSQSALLGIETFKDIAKKLGPGVANINTAKIIERRAIDPFWNFFGMDPFSQQQSRPQRQTVTNLGSGLVISSDGYILTNRHVVDGADEIRVSLENGKKGYDAKLVGKDARTDVALLKIEPKDPLTVLPLGDSDLAEVGDWVMAIGSPFGLGNSVTVGVISFKGRPVYLREGMSMDMLQTDASINPGNSGGPLINTRGEVIGINTLIISGGVAQSAGVGFAVPVNVAKQILPQLREKGHVVRGWLGVVIRDMSEDLAKTYGLTDVVGAVVMEVTSGSPAEEAGIEPEDVVLRVDGREIQDSSGLSSYIALKTPGTTVRLDIHRGRNVRSVTVKLGTFPDEDENASEEEKGNARLGMRVEELTPRLAQRLDLPRSAAGLVVMDVEAGGAAENAGLRAGDLIVSVNGVSVENASEFERLIARARQSGVARLRVRRGDGYRLAVLKLE
ncbi:MAG: Do family serine endopeptidase [Vicinamibacteria bacterium]|nr:Do family serine endopeptidase [Vicinamibacteria bacterium]